MPRTIRLVAIGLAAIAAFAAATAQPDPQFPDCNWQEINAKLEAREIPDFSGCPAKAAMTRVRQAFGASVPVTLHPDSNPSAWRLGTVTRQVQEGRQVQLYYAARPIQAEAAPAAPPPPVIVSTAPPAPPPPQPLPPAAVIPAGTPVPTINPDVPPTEIYQNVTFSIADAAPVEAGKPLVFQVTREGFDGRAHEVRFHYSGGGLLLDPPQSMRFEPGDPSQKDLRVQTAPVQSGDGDSTVLVLMLPGEEGTSIGARSASGTITQAAPQPQLAVTYSILPDGAFNRGHDLPFTVTRTGPLGPARIPYRVSHDDPASMIDDSVRYVEFAEGQPSVPLVIPADRVGQCATTVTVTLEDGAATSASASFVEPLPEVCGPPPPEVDYVPLILGCVALVSALILDKILKPFVTVHPSCTITPGAPAFRALEQPVSRWPEVRADVAIEPGELHVTQPLPRSEPADG